MKIQWLSKYTVDNTYYISKRELSLYSHNVSTVMVLKYRVFSISSLKAPALCETSKISQQKRSSQQLQAEILGKISFARFVQEKVCSLGIIRFVRKSNCS